MVHHNAHANDLYTKEFGIQISDKLAQFKYNDSGREKDPLLQVGLWNMMNKNVQDSVARSFCHEWAQMCMASDMAFNPQPVLPVFQLLPGSGDPKWIREMDMGTVSQCFLQKHIYMMSKQYLAIVYLKNNAKVSGRNTVLVTILVRL
ncbi:hypothetical protein C2S51_009873 [Perilla frutescens var. frutescens]|nr:hypothetical protein C2S51_009873 [Perilla frutescens var. frutescens]